jgi:hypothetical protein
VVSIVVERCCMIYGEMKSIIHEGKWKGLITWSNLSCMGFNDLSLLVQYIMRGVNSMAHF